MVFSQKNFLFVFTIFSISFFLSCKTRNMNEGSSRSSSSFGASEICGSIIFDKINSDKSSSIFLRTDWNTATRVSEAFRTGRDSTQRLVEVIFPSGFPAPRKRDVQDAPQKIACVNGEFAQKRIVARSFTLRDSSLNEREITACGEIFEEEDLFGIHLPNDPAKSPVLVLGRNTKKTRQMLGSLVGKSACVKGRPFLAQEHLALLTDSASIVRVERSDAQLSVDSHYRLSDDPEEHGKARGRRFLNEISGETKRDQIERLTDHILRLETLSEENKWRTIESELSDNPGKDAQIENSNYWKSRLDAEIIECCDELNELINDRKNDGGFFQKIFRKGANPSTMYMDGKNDFSELRKNELYDGDVDLELDLL
ncbi:MAG: hypothetical protein ING65_12745 [Rhodocyclaceae bacterium]|nr:hypothetical protein [Rhodocyclaceae bacterium]